MRYRYLYANYACRAKEDQKLGGAAEYQPIFSQSL